MRLAARLRKLQAITKTARPCEHCLVTEEAEGILKEYLATCGVKVHDTGIQKPSRLGIRECLQCGKRVFYDTSHRTKEEAAFLGSMYSEFYMSCRQGDEFSPELDQKIQSFFELERQRERERYGEHYDGALQAATKFI